MLIFQSEAHITRWCRERGIERGGTMTPQQMWELASAWYSRRLEPDWQRYTLDEARRIFETIGLTGAFWQLAP